MATILIPDERLDTIQSTMRRAMQELADAERMPGCYTHESIPKWVLDFVNGHGFHVNDCGVVAPNRLYRKPKVVDMRG